MTITTFDSVASSSHSGVTAATYDEWRFGSYGNSYINIANGDNSSSSMTVPLNQSGGRSILLNAASSTGQSDYYFRHSDGSNFQLNSFMIDNGNGTGQYTFSVKVTGYRNGDATTSSAVIYLNTDNDSHGVTYTRTINSSSSEGGRMSFDSTYSNVDQIRLVAQDSSSQDINNQLSIDDIDASPAAPLAIISATYDASSGTLAVTGTSFPQASGPANDIVAAKFAFVGEGGSTYTLTDSANVEITSSTAFTIVLSAADKAAVNQIVNKNGTSSTDGTIYNLAAAEDWAAGTYGPVVIADTTGNGITVSNVAVPTITSATYDASSGTMMVTGTGFLQASGAANDIVAARFTFTGEGGSTYTLTDSANVEITSVTAFTIALSAADKAAVDQIVNKNGASSTDGTIYNLVAAEDWAAGADSAVVIADTTGNGITVSNVAVPAITSATYDASSGTMVVTGTGFLQASGAANDIDTSKLTLTGQGGATYTLTSPGVEITSGTAFTIALNAADKIAVNHLLNKAGTASNNTTTYNLAADDGWAAGADSAVADADLTGNGITVSIPTPSSGGGGSHTTNITIDGATATMTTQPDGTVVIAVPTIQSSRQDDPTSLFRDRADIPVAQDAKGNSLLTVSLPTGTGLTAAEWPQVTSPTQAETNMIAALGQIGGLSGATADDLTAQARAFLAPLPSSNPANIQTVTPNVSGNQPPALPIIISGPAVASTTNNLLVIDARQLPADTTIQLDNVAFALVVGAARIVGGSGQNFVAGDDQNQFIVLGADDDILSGGGGNDTVGSLGGNDQVSGDAGNDIVYGGAGNDFLSGGSGNDQLNGGFGFDSAIQVG